MSNQHNAPNSDSGQAGSGDIESPIRALSDIPADERAKVPMDDSAAQPDSENELGLAASTWRVAKSLFKMRDQLNAKSPNRSKASDGFIGDLSHQQHNSDHNPHVKDGSVGVVTAFDVTHDPTHGCDAGKLADTLHAKRDSRIKYIIWNRRIANASAIGAHPAWEWRPYTGASPHTEHIHISVKGDKPHYDSTTAWEL